MHDVVRLTTSVCFYRVRPEAEVRKHMARRRKRKREKGGAPAADPASEPAEQARAPADAADASNAPTASDELAPFQVGFVALPHLCPNWFARS